MKMLTDSSVIVDMNRRGASAAFNIMTGEGANARLNIYGFLVGTKIVRVMKNGVDLIDENDVLDPLHPTTAERSVIAMSKDLDGFDEHLYDLGCALAVLYNNDASDDYAARWLKERIEEILSSEN